MKWKHRRAAFSRPSLDEVLAFRTHVDEAMEKLLAGQIHDDAARRILLGLNHEQQHQELMLTDIKHAFLLESTGSGVQCQPPLGSTGRFTVRLHVASLPWRCD